MSRRAAPRDDRGQPLLEAPDVSQTLYRLGGVAARRPWTVIAAWLVLAVLVVAASSAFGAELEDSFRVPGLDSQQANDLLESAGSGQAGLTAQVVVTPADGGSFTATPRRARHWPGCRSAPPPAHALSTTDPAGVLTGTSDESGVVSPDGRVALVRIQYPSIGELSAADLGNLKALDGGPDLRVEKGGDLYFAFEESDGQRRGARRCRGGPRDPLPRIRVRDGRGAADRHGGPRARARDRCDGAARERHGDPQLAPVLGAMVGLGVGIDYALFVTTRHREYLARGLAVQDSIARSIATAGRPVVFAGGIVVVSILGLAVAGVPFMTAGGIAISMVVLIMVVASVTLLPALLAVSGRRVVGRRAVHATSPGWARWTRHVTRHPRVYLVASLPCSFALAAPVLALRVGIPDDGALPPSFTQRQAYDLVAQGFGPGRNGPLVVAVAAGGRRRGSRTAGQAIAHDPGIAGVEPPVVRGDVGTIVAYATTGPQEAETHDTIERLRSEVFPAALADSPARAHVGGQTANFADVGVRVNDRLPAFVLAVLGMSFLLLMLVFRSVLVPLKAVLLNLLSIGASYGVMVMVFQWGRGAGPDRARVDRADRVVHPDVHVRDPVRALDGLRGVPAQPRTRGVVAHGVERAGCGRTAWPRPDGSSRPRPRIMVCVFLAFVLGEDAATKMFGVGLSTAILVDATLVRMVLVPATMKLLGRANWWVPRWLDRVLPRVDVDGEERLPEPKVLVPA